MKDGLKDSQRDAVISILKQSPHLERAFLFGSRAMGTYTSTSDIDIALEGDDLSLTDQTKLAQEIEHLTLPYTVDLVRTHTITNPELKKHIKQCGAVWFERQETRKVDQSKLRGAGVVSEWAPRKIGTLGKVITGKTPSTKDGNNFGSEYPFITIPDLDGRKDIDSSERYLSSKGAKLVRNQLLPSGSVLMSCIATVGKCGITTRDSFTNQQINSVIPNESVLPEFLYYTFFKLGRALENHGGGGSVYTNVSKSRFSDIEVLIPDLYTQSEVANILSTFDDKIALNRKMNATLEAMAQALFQSWFVDFDPVKAKLAAVRCGRDPEQAAMAAIACKLVVPPGKPKPETLDAILPNAEAIDTAIATLNDLTKAQLQSLKEKATPFPSDFQDSEIGIIPKGWQVKSFSGFCEINPQRTLKKGTLATYLDMKSVPTSGPSADGYYEREFTSGTKFINGDTLLARITPCLENGKTAYVDFLSENAVGWGSTEFIVIRPNAVTSAIGYFLARSKDVRTHAISNMTGTSGRQRVPPECFDNLLLTFPSSLALLNEFGVTAELVQAQIKANSNYSRTLANLRDMLLPKLISGELRILEAKKFTKEALV